jgi:hypothetical protein
LEVREDILGVKITHQAAAGSTIAITRDINVDYHPGGNGASHTPDPADIGYTKQNIAHLKAAGYNDASVKSEIYPTGTHFYEAAHFSWIVGYQDTSIRDWLFAQSK